MTTGTRRRALEEALDTAPNDTATRLVLADLCEEEGEWERAAWYRLTAVGDPLIECGDWQVHAGVGGVPALTLTAENSRAERVWAWWPSGGQHPWMELHAGPVRAHEMMPPADVRAAVEAAGFEALRLLRAP